MYLQIFEFCCLFKRLISCPYFLVLFLFPMTRHNHILCNLYFYCQTNSPSSLQKCSWIPFLSFSLSPNKLNISSLTSSWCFNSIPNGLHFIGLTWWHILKQNWRSITVEYLVVSTHSHRKFITQNLPLRTFI
jgi:hypothetical protein